MPDVSTFPPTKDNELAAWSLNFSTKITATPTAFGLTAAQATAYAALNTAYATAFATVITPTGNSKANIILKNQAKQNLLNNPGGAWELTEIVQAFPGTTDFMRGELGLRIPDVEPTPVPAPAYAPELAIVSTVGRTVTIRLRDARNPDRRGKPEGVDGATVIYHAGENPPADPQTWMFSINTSKTVTDITIPTSITPGTKFWVSAFWFNQRKQSSPSATPESIRVPDGLAKAA